MNRRTLVTVLLLGGLGGLGALCALLALLARSASDGAAPAAPPRAEESPAAGAPAVAAAAAPVDPAAAARAEAVPELSPPVDLSACDRDRDLFGVVLDRQRRPVPGAAVAALFRPWRRTMVLNYAAYDDTTPGPSALAAADGSFSLRLAPGDVVDLDVSAAGHARGVVPSCQAGERVEVVLEPACALSIAAVDEAGAPVAGARVKLSRSGSTAGDRSGATGADGRLEFGDLAPGDVSVRASHDALGSAPSAECRLAPGAPAEVALAFPAGRAIRGRVTDAATGRPIEGAAVGAGIRQSRAVATDADGRYVHAGWTGSGEVHLEATAAGYGRARRAVGDASECDFALALGDRVRGRLVGADGAPVAAALVTAFATEQRADGQAVDSQSFATAADGRFEIGSVSREFAFHTLVVQARGHGRTLLDFEPHPGGPGAIDLGDVVLAAPRTVRGRAIDGSGAPLPRASVTLVGANADRGRLRPGVVPPPELDIYGTRESRCTDDLGRFRFGDLAPGSYRVLLNAQGRESVERGAVLAPEDFVVEVVLQTSSGRALTVRAIDVRGAPLAGVRVELERMGTRSSATTDSSGAASFFGPRAGHVGVEVQPKPGYARAFVRVPPDADEIVVEVRASARVEGRVVDEHGAPLARIGVRASGSSVGQLSREDGTFALALPEGVPVELYLATTESAVAADRTLQFLPSPYRARLPGIVPPAFGVTLVARSIGSAGSVAARVVDGEGRAVPGARVTVSSESGEVWASAETDSEGRARFEGLPEEPCRLSASSAAAATGAERSAPVGVEPDGREVELELRGNVQVRVRVIDRDGRPLAGAALHVFAEAFEGSGWRTEATGWSALWLPPELRFNVEATVPGPDGTPRRGAAAGEARDGAEIVVRVAG